MQLIIRSLAYTAVVVFAILNIAGSRVILLSMASVWEEHRSGTQAVVDSSSLTQIWTDSRDPDPAVVVHDNGTTLQWGGERYKVISVIHSGEETLYVCSRDESLSDGWLRISGVSRQESNPLKLALTGKVISDYFTPQFGFAEILSPQSGHLFTQQDEEAISVSQASPSPPPKAV